MPHDPLRGIHVRQLIEQLRGVDAGEGQRLIAKWLAEDRITKAELVASLIAFDRARLLGAPPPPYINYISRMSLLATPNGQERMRQWEHATEQWKKLYLSH